MAIERIVPAVGEPGPLRSFVPTFHPPSEGERVRYLIEQADKGSTITLSWANAKISATRETWLEWAADW